MVDSDSGEAGSGDLSLKLHPVHGRSATPWTLQCEGGSLSLFSDDARLVMMFPREEAAHHLRFDRDLFHGLVLSIESAEAFHLHRFKCRSQDMSLLLSWLPRKSPAQLRTEVRRYGLALLMLSVVVFLLPSIFFWGWGILFVLQGLAMLLFPRRLLFVSNGILMLSAGLAYLFLQPPPPIRFVEWIDFAGPIRTGAGSFLLIWGIQQFSLLGANHRLRVARRGGSLRIGENYVPSRVVRKVIWALTGLLIIEICQVAGLLAHAWYGNAVLSDWVLCLTLAGVTLGVLLILRLRTRSGYLEARSAGQFVICLGAIHLAGALAYPLENRLPFTPDVLWYGLFALSEPYIWAPLIGFILLFNHWFNRQVERESGSTGE